MAKKKQTEEISLNVSSEEIQKSFIKDVEKGMDSNRALKLEIIEQIEKINNRYYLLIIKKYIDKLGG